MGLDENQMGYFIQQVGLSAASFGVSKEDVQAVGMTLDKVFNKRCSPATAAIPALGPQLESMCIASSCPLDAMASCSLYEHDGTGARPKVANASLAGNASSTATASVSSTAGSTASPSASKSPTATGAATAERVGNFAAIAGAILLAIVL
jgi:hypothetical protein